MGPLSLYLGPEVPSEELIWQDPLPATGSTTLDADSISNLKSQILNSGLSISELVSTAWASASTYRASDKRGGANGARVRLTPQKDWKVNNPAQLQSVLTKLESIQSTFNSQNGKRVSLADLIVLGGSAAIEQAAKNGGLEVSVPFSAGRSDASQEVTDVESFGYLEPEADGFRNYVKGNYAVTAEEMLVDKAQLMTLTAPELTALVGGLRVLNTNFDGSSLGVFTHQKDSLSNDFFVNLLDMSTAWNKSSDDETVFEGKDRKSGELKWKASRVDLIFGSNSELRAIAEVYACSDSKEKFVKDFVKAWTKVMNLDRFDLKNNVA